MLDRTTLKAELTMLLRTMLVAQAQGVSGSRFAFARQNVNEEIERLTRHGLMTQREILAIIAEQRAAVFGPALASECGL